MNNGVKCGYCGGQHDTAAEVKACWATNMASQPPASITEKQVTFLTDLLERKVHPVGFKAPADVEKLDKSTASEMISLLVAQPRKPVSETSVPQDIPDGRYAYHNTTLNKILFYSITTRDDGLRRVRKVLGSPGDFRYVPIREAEANAFIKAIQDDPAYASQMFGLSVGACGICGSPLTNKVSRQLGMGPHCRKKYGW